MSDNTKNSISDQNLLVRMSKGDEKAFYLLYKKYWDSLYNAAFKRLKDHDMCENAVQNVFVDLWNRKETLSVGNVSAYLHSAVKYQVFGLIVKKKGEVYFTEPFESIVKSPFSADGELIERELQHVLEKWLESLPEKRRKIFLMYYDKELSSREISERLSIAQKTVQNQVRTATKSLRLRLTQFMSLFL
ncbi:RNA polymerase sigma factor [Membranihabitans maritimus]|uniref:RNA polymerase sigma factor n=1 Tax=Membranihabitans maritimus TaxID=2904244 RepID=UPI001F023E84|nr:sigma-70 family RNA polymerase sigma factor [Membranihabitans maritimus]